MARGTNLFAKLSLDYADHPKIMRLSDAAFRVHIEMILYARKYETDGVIPNPVANRLGFGYETDPVSELCNNDPDAPSLRKLDNGDYVLHGYSEMQETRADIEARRKRNASNGSKGGRPKTQKKPSGFQNENPLANPNRTQKKAESESESDIEVVLRTTAQPAHASQAKFEHATEFDRFWSAYPRHVGKQRARSKYAAAAKRADEETIIAGAQRLASDPNLPEQQFIPHPSTWLERDGWEDEPLPPRIDNRGGMTFDQQAMAQNNAVTEAYLRGGDPWPMQQQRSLPNS